MRGTTSLDSLDREPWRQLGGISPTQFEQFPFAEPTDGDSLVNCAFGCESQAPVVQFNSLETDAESSSMILGNLPWPAY